MKKKQQPATQIIQQESVIETIENVDQPVNENSEPVIQPTAPVVSITKQQMQKEKQMIQAMLHFILEKGIAAKTIDTANPTNQTNNTPELEIHGILKPGSIKNADNFNWRIWMDRNDLDEKSLPKRFMALRKEGSEEDIVFEVTTSIHLTLLLDHFDFHAKPILAEEKTVTE